MTTFYWEIDRYFDEAGWGRIEHEEVPEGVGALVASEWAESDPYESRSGPGCHVSMGFWRSYSPVPPASQSR